MATRDEQNQELLTQWHKRSLWGNFNPDDKTTEAEMNERIGRTLAYVMRRLSRGVIPNPDLVFDALGGKRKAPPCGYIECPLHDFEHVH